MPRPSSGRACPHCSAPMPRGAPGFRARRCAHCRQWSGSGKSVSPLRSVVRRLEQGIDRRHLTATEVSHLRSLLDTAMQEAYMREHFGMPRPRRISHGGMTFALSYTNFGRVIVSKPDGLPIAASTYFAL